MSISSNKQAQQKQKELASGLNHRWLDQQSHSVAKYHRQFKMSVDEETDSKEFTLRISLSQERGDTTTVRPKNSNNNNNLVPETIRDQYRRDGFVVFPNVLSQEDVNALNDRLEKVLRGDYDRQQKPDKTPRLLKSHYETHQFDEGKDDSAADHLDNNNNNSTKRKKGGASSMAKGPLGFSGNLQNVKVLQVINVHKADHLFRCLAVSPALGKAVAELAGWEHGARLAQDQVWAKPPGASPLVFHRDSPYFMFDDPSVVTVWVALDTMDSELGPLEYVRGSHQWGDGRVGSANQFFQNNGGMKLVRSAAEKEGISWNDIEIVSMTGLEAGGISIHDGRTWHGSGRNNSTKRPRRGLGLHFVPAHVRFTPEAANSKLWNRYVRDVEHTFTELPLEDFPITWQP